jgi:hypothetical protein
VTRRIIRKPRGKLWEAWRKLAKDSAITTPEIAAKTLKISLKNAEKILKRLSKGGWAVPMVTLTPHTTQKYQVLPESEWPETISVRWNETDR